MNRPRWPVWVACLGCAVYAFLYLPLLIVVAYSFNDSRLNAEWDGFTLHWYDVLANDPDMLGAAWNSLMIGAIAAGTSCVLGTLAAIALHRYRPPLLATLVLAPIAMPEVLMGVSLLLFFVAVNIDLGLTAVALSHITFCVGFVAVVVRARLEGLDESLIDAARDLGASPLQAGWHVMLPLMLPGVLAGALLAFTLSMDDFVVTFFTAGPGQPTLPLQIYSMIRIAVTPEVNAISSILMMLTLAVSLTAYRVSRDVWRAQL
ncbi:spermidine/putrescine ABC transporter permease [Cupriavidus sp. SHE]|jgi:spermidine/putrescine transport system permease protein|uniref:ABC transporter permease n=1 Tax=Cupriavidus metallidurans TaxID=119219 RepID=A0A2L0X3A0_9BURK|nr:MULTISPECIES: ABC transporter permease [Cupriavidus]AVA34594.1 ABC transporter permease [Cupriavidus metallidurans]KWR82551.1 spermidine/putrescine ABC transporter permease [Cupriavidus sp. SHE]QBP12358.1 ABC transporter permease [Cupriavidus metallidurans]